MRNFYFIGKVDVAPVVEAIAAKPDLWNENPDRLIGFNMVQEAEFDDIWVHMTSSMQGMSRDEVMANLTGLSHGTKWHRAYFELPLKPLLYQLLSFVDGEAFGRVFISRLAPGKSIFPHKDVDLEAFTRFHIALENAPGAVFKCGDEVAQPDVGDVFWFDNQTEHSVENNSNANRLTMVVDVVTPHRSFFFDRQFRT